MVIQSKALSMFVRIDDTILSQVLNWTKSSTTQNSVNKNVIITILELIHQPSLQRVMR